MPVCLSHMRVCAALVHFWRDNNLGFETASQDVELLVFVFQLPPPVGLGRDILRYARLAYRRRERKLIATAGSTPIG